MPRMGGQKKSNVLKFLVSSYLPLDISFAWKFQMLSKIQVLFFVSKKSVSFSLSSFFTMCLVASNVRMGKSPIGNSA